jgi:hypothetical protein
MTNDELELAEWVLDTLIAAGEAGAQAMTYDELDHWAIAEGIIPQGKRLTKTPEFAKIKECFLEHYAIH